MAKKTAHGTDSNTLVQDAQPLKPEVLGHKPAVASIEKFPMPQKLAYDIQEPDETWTVDQLRDHIEDIQGSISIRLRRTIYETWVLGKTLHLLQKSIAEAPVPEGQKRPNWKEEVLPQIGINHVSAGHFIAISKLPKETATGYENITALLKAMGRIAVPPDKQLDGPQTASEATEEAKTSEAASASEKASEAKQKDDDEEKPLDELDKEDEVKEDDKTNPLWAVSLVVTGNGITKAIQQDLIKNGLMVVGRPTTKRIEAVLWLGGEAEDESEPKVAGVKRLGKRIAKANPTSKVEIRSLFAMDPE